MYEIKKKTNWQDLIMNYWDEYGTGVVIKGGQISGKKTIAELTKK